MKITDNLSSYLSSLLQETQKASNSTAAGSSQFTVSGTGSGDMIEISGEAYDSLAAGSSNGRMPPPPPSMDASEALSGLVDDGTITDDQAEAITTAIQNAVSSKSSSDSSDTSAGTSSAGSNPLESLLDGLVSDGTLTEDQATSVGQALTPPPPPPPMGMRGPGGAGGSGVQGSTETAAGSTSDENTDLIKNIVNSLLDNGTNSTGSIGSLLQLLNSLDTDTLKTVYADLSGDKASTTA
jgi:polyhydroxyalkanoate synthesis regulator phasin